MLRLINLASLDRGLMNIVLFLPKHRFTFYDLGVKAFFPDLVNGFLFMRTLEMSGFPSWSLGTRKILASRRGALRAPARTVQFLRQVTRGSSPGSDTHKDI